MLLALLLAVIEDAQKQLAVAAGATVHETICARAPRQGGGPPRVGQQQLRRRRGVLRHREHVPSDREGPRGEGPQRQREDDAEVGAATAKGPQQLGLLPRVHAQVPAVGHHHLGRQDAVRGQAAAAGKVADTALQDHPQAHTGRGAQGHDEPVAAGRRQDVGGGRPATCRHRPGLRVDLDAPEVPQVQDDVPRTAVGRVGAPHDGD